MAPHSAGAFTLLGVSLALVRARGRTAAFIADLAAFLFFLAVLVLVSGYVFGALRLFNFSPGIMTSPQTLFCLLLLLAVVLMRRAEHGVLAIFLGRGIGSTLARVLAPILLALPFLREIGRERLIHANVISGHYVTALLASTAAGISLLLLLYLAWRINSMELEIRELSLRDDLTGLYNRKGFTLLAEQALKLARRNQLPFSVLFIDLDDLKNINDELGHAYGSAYITETGKLLLSTFRETDVLGRIGGDEFTVAGQFSPVAVSIAVQRLQAAVAARNAEAGRRLPLSLSVGSVTSGEHGQDSLGDMIGRADRAMYREKRRRKQLPR
jgi:diguanylate cyclase (GGDEF)-like protein